MVPSAVTHRDLKTGMYSPIIDADLFAAAKDIYLNADEPTNSSDYVEEFFLSCLAEEIRFSRCILSVFLRRPNIL